jgi:hypothetical protein
MYEKKTDHSSSHIILRFVVRNPRRKHISAPLYLSPYVTWINEDEKYFCSCQPKVKTTMTQLLKHVQEAHNGVSPLYHGNFIYKKNKR